MRDLFRSVAAPLCLASALAAQTSAPVAIPLPAKHAADAIDGPPFVTAVAWAIGDAKTGELLWGRNQERELPMASTTKIMTAHLVLRMAEKTPRILDDTVVVSRFAGNTGGSSARLRPGDRLSVKQLLYGLLLPSGNDAANALAEHFGGRFAAPKDPKAIPWNVRSAGRSPAWIRFVAEMNREAKRMKMKKTRYVNPHGLDAPRHYSCASDILLLARAAMQHAEFRRRVATRAYRCAVVSASGSRRVESWKNTNRLLGIEGYRGVKTGTTTKAGACLVANAVRGEDSLFVVVLDSAARGGRYVDTRNLFRWAFQQRLEGGK